MKHSGIARAIAALATVVVVAGACSTAATPSPAAPSAAAPSAAAASPSAAAKTYTIGVSVVSVLILSVHGALDGALLHVRDAVGTE